MTEKLPLNPWVRADSGDWWYRVAGNEDEGTDEVVMIARKFPDGWRCLFSPDPDAPMDPRTDEINYPYPIPDGKPFEFLVTAQAHLSLLYHGWDPEERTPREEARNRLRAVLPEMQVWGNVLRMKNAGSKLMLGTLAQREDGSGQIGTTWEFDPFMSDLTLLVGDEIKERADASLRLDNWLEGKPIE